MCQFFMAFNNLCRKVFSVRVSCAGKSWETLMYGVREWQKALRITLRIPKSWRFVERECENFCRVWCDTVLSGKSILKWWRYPSSVWIGWCILWRRSSNFPKMSVFVFKQQRNERCSPSIHSSRHIFTVHYKYLSVVRSFEGKRPFRRFRPRG